MNYEERYGERILTDKEENELQERINIKEKNEIYEKVINTIKEIVSNLGELSLDEYKEIIKEIRWEVENL